MNRLHQMYPKRLLLVIAIGILLLPFLLYSQLYSLRPPHTDQSLALFQGIVYQRQVRSTPRAMMLHIVTVDLTTPGIGVMVTPGKPTADGGETHARTTAEFVKEFKLQLGINGNFFSPFHEYTPWDYYPHSGDPVQVVGQAISQGSTYSPSEPDWPALCFLQDHHAQIFDNGQCPPGTVEAVAGSPLLLFRGQKVPPKWNSPDAHGLYSRTAIGIDRSGKTLWLVAIDDQQPLYSEGATLTELTEILTQLGVYTAINLDGGGSTTLVVADHEGTRLLNAPIHTKLPMHQRPVGNHLGIYAQALVQ